MNKFSLNVDLIELDDWSLRSRLRMVLSKLYDYLSKIDRSLRSRLLKLLLCLFDSLRVQDMLRVCGQSLNLRLRLPLLQRGPQCGSCRRRSRAFVTMS